MPIDVNGDTGLYAWMDSKLRPSVCRADYPNHWTTATVRHIENTFGGVWRLQVLVCTPFDRDEPFLPYIEVKYVRLLG